MKAILSIDQSTSGTKGLVWDERGALLARADVPHRQITNAQGWVEHDLMEIYHNTLKAARLALEKSGVDARDITVIGISNQRETAACWDRKTRKPLYNAIVWQCARAVDVVDSVRQAGLADEVRKRTGLQLSPYFSAAKFGWMVRRVPEVAEAKECGTLCCGTIDSWLIYNLTGEFKVDYSNASRTQLLNLRTLGWDAEIAAAFGLDITCLPKPCDSDSLFGYTDFGGLFPHLVPIHGVMGDSHAALFGNCCWEPGTAKATYGTGSSVMMNAGKICPEPNEGVAASLAWGMNGSVSYVLEGNINYTGAVIKWLVDDIALLPDAKSAGRLAETVENTGGVYLVPAFSGLGAPYFNNNARAAFLGMNRSTMRAHLVRAAEECIAYQVRDVIEAINCSSGKSISVLRVDGGPSKDTFLMQFQADMLNIPLEISEREELSGFGAAACAAIGAGLSDRESFFSVQQRNQIAPRMSAEHCETLYCGWKKAVATISKERET